MSRGVQATIGIILAAIGGILALVGFAGFMHGLYTSNTQEYMSMELLLIIGPALFPVGLYFIIAAAVSAAPVKKN